MAKETGLTIFVPASMLLEDNDQWTNRFFVKGESINRSTGLANKYIIAQHKVKRHWGCSCGGFCVSHKKGEPPNRDCKHLRNIGLPGKEVPFEAKLTSGEPHPNVAPRKKSA